ncbi:DMT family transporter [Halocatena marina]|uniref:DMT family transporter n=1 Tax=Halocatena marina TaxID=2934937 RepID=A0ABD5YP19_9EURY|nr:DMT family transporter [Halocatena marina]
MANVVRRERNVETRSSRSCGVRYRNLILFLVLALVWGSSFMAIKAGLEYFPPVLYAAVRYDIAGIVMLGYAWYVLDDPIPRTRGEWLLVLIGAVFLIAAYHSLLFIGEKNEAVTSASAAIIVSLSPVLTTACARVMLPSERLEPIGLAGLVLGLVGVGVLVRPDPSNLLSADVLANLLIFAAALAFAFGTVLMRRLDATLHIESLEAWSMLGGALLMHGISLAIGESPTGITLTIEAIAAIGYLSLFSSALGFLIYFDLLAQLGPIEINLVSYVAPLFAAIAGFLFLDEGITTATTVGFLIIVAGFALIKRETIRREVNSLRATSMAQSDD